MRTVVSSYRLAELAGGPEQLTPYHCFAFYPFLWTQNGWGQTLRV